MFWRRLTYTLLAVSAVTVAVADRHYQINSKGIVVGGARFQVLSDKLVRFEYSPNGSFTDTPTAVVANRLSPVQAKVNEANGWVSISSKTYTVRYRVNSGAFTPKNLEVKWDGGSWVPGQKDNLNLRGTPEALDGLSRSFMPSLKEGPLSRSGYWLLDDSATPLIDPSTKWVVEKPKPWSTDQYLLIYGKDYKSALKEYTRLLGDSPKIPRYALGCWYSRYWDYTDQELKDIVGEFRKRSIPLDVLVVDVDWHKHGWEGYDWNTNSFPDPLGFMKWVKDAGLKLTLNTHPSTIVANDTHTPKVRKMLGLPEEKGDYEFNFARKGDADAFNKICLNPLVDQGVTFWWIDGNRAYMPGLNSPLWTAHTYYTNQEQHTGLRSLIFTRYGSTGSHRYPLGFSGDTVAQWETLRYEVGMTPIAGQVLWQWSHDIGGFHGDKIEEELMARWTQFGAFTPVLRLHSNHGERLPWAYEPRTEKIMTDAMRLHNRLIPYIYSLQDEFINESVPTYRPVYLEDPSDVKGYQHIYQYLVGKDILVAPASEPTKKGVTVVPVYLPKGKWFDFFTGHPYDGDRVLLYPAKLEDIPSFAKAGAIIPMQADKQYDADAQADKTLTLHVYRGANGSFTLVEDDGLSLDYRKGKVAKTKLTLKDNKDGCTFLIAAQEGTYQGAPEKRKLEVVFYGGSNPKSVKVNGKEVKNGFFGVDSRTFRLSLGERPVAEVITIELSDPNGQAQYDFHFRANALLDRIQRLTPEIKNPLRQELEQLSDSIEKVDSGKQKPYALAPLLIQWANQLKQQGRTIDQVRRLLNVQVHADLEMAEPFGFVDTMPAYATWDENLPKNGLSIDLVAPKGFEFTRISPNQAGFGRWELREPVTSPRGAFEAIIRCHGSLGGGSFDWNSSFTWTNDYVTDWKVLGQFKEMNPKKDELEIVPGKTVDFGKTYDGVNGQAKWINLSDFQTQFKVTLPRKIDFRKKWQENDNHCYAVTYLYAPTERDVRFDIGSDDTFVCWLNQVIVGRCDTPRIATAGDDKLKVHLKKGWNEVIVRVGNGGGEWELIFEIKTPTGKPDSEVRVSTTPK